jgi:alkaline phosphatase
MLTFIQMRLLSTFFLLSALIMPAAEKRAKNVILFIGDAGGIPTLNAASIHGYREPHKLFVQNMPHLGLMDTSAASSWVTDSAAAMTAIVTGQKTDNGVLSESAAVPGTKERTPLKTILEYAEERGLSTGVISNSSMADATPAACYSHVDNRGKFGEIFAQVLKPRFGDGVDLIIGSGRKAIFDATAKLGIDLEPALRQKGYAVYSAPDAVGADAGRVVSLFDAADYDLGAVVQRATGILSRNRKGFFLMVEWDVHTNNARRGLDRVLVLDNVIRQTASRVNKDTLIIFAADHSFDLRVQRGRKSEPLLPPDSASASSNPAAKPNVRVDDSHTGEQVLVASQGPGSGRVKGFFANTDLFQIMMSAYGWKDGQSAR